MTKGSSKKSLKVVVTLTLVGVMAGAWVMACGHDSVPTAATATPAKRAAIRAHRDTTGVGSELARFHHSMEKMKWVGELHHAAMQELIARQQEVLVGTGSLNERKCRLVLDVTSHYVEQADAKANHAAGDSPHARAKEAVSHSVACRGVAVSNIFARSPVAAFPRSPIPGDDYVSGNFLYYIDYITPVIGQSDGTVAGVAGVLDAAFTQAYSDQGGAHFLSAGDLDILADVADMALSSTAEWNSYPYDNPDEDVSPASIFRRPPIPRWLKGTFLIGGADVIGCATAAVATWWSGAAGAGSACLIWGAGASAGEALSFFFG